MLWQLIWANTLIIALDVTLLGIQCANLFHLQGAFKPCVYGIKLKLEFVILNRLINTVRQGSSEVFYSGSGEGGGVDGASGPSGSSGDHHQPPTIGSHGSPRMRGNSLWLKTEPGEDVNDVQLVQSISRSAGRDHSVGSETPIYHGTEAV